MVNKMFDIDTLVFGTKKKSKPLPKLKTTGLKSFNLLGGSSRHFIIGDRITPKQRVAMKKDPFGDWDRDGVINGLDCQPRNKKKHMAWKKPGPGIYTQQMSPREYLNLANGANFGRMPNPEDPFHHKYYDTKTQQMEHIDKLGQHIKSKNVEVEIPYVDPEQSSDHEGRHRAYAAERAGIKSIPVQLPPPESWRTKEVHETFMKKAFPHESVDSAYGKTWKYRIQETPFPTQQMGSKARQSYYETLQEKGLIAKPLNSNINFAARKAVRELGEVDKEGVCLGNCEVISKHLAEKIPGSKVVRSMYKDEGGEHRALLLPDDKVVDTQRWQKESGNPDKIETRKVVFDRKDYEKDGYEITDAPNTNDGGKQ